MKNPKLIINYLVFFIVLGSFFYYKEFYLKKQEQSTSSEIKTTEEEIINNDSNEESTPVCNICGEEFNGNGYEEQIDGSFKELEYPYSNQICSPSCGRKASQKLDDVARKYNVELDEQNNETSTNTKGDYHMGNDGRVYENNKCGLCKGTGIERGRNIATGEEQGRICPMCEGRGVRSY